MSARYPAGIPTRLSITLEDGRQLVREVEFPCGHARNPMTDEEVEAKFVRLAEPRFGKERCAAILATCWQLEKLRNVSSLLKLVE
jgi:2-methylcitrate dehydratase